MSNKDIDSYFGDGVKLNGSLKFKGVMRFDGKFQGSIESDGSFIVGKHGNLQAKLNVGELHNFGTIKGRVDALRKIFLHGDSSLEGDIVTPVLSSVDNALFNGICHMPLDKRLPLEEEIPDSKISETIQIDNCLMPVTEMIDQDIKPATPYYSKVKVLIILTIVTLLFGAVLYNTFYNTLVSTKHEEIKVVAPNVETTPVVDFTVQESEKLKNDATNNPTDQSKQVRYLTSLVENEEYKEAIDYAKSLLESQTTQVESRLFLAETLYRAGKEKEAMEHFKLYAAQVEGDNLVKLANDGYVALEIRAAKKARELFEKSLEIDPLYMRGRVGLATSLLMLNEYELARNELDSILTQSRNYAPAFNVMAQLEMVDDSTIESARMFAEESLQFFDNIPNYLDTLAEIHYKLGDKEEAIRLISKAIDESPDDPSFKQALFRYQNLPE
ncbi:MAG: polymer-forming cytoskeletal protein [Nitrospinota bacterium]